jgi:hypothetical protein
MKLDVLAMTLSVGIVWGIAVFFYTWWLILWEGASPEPTFLSRVYRGYKVTPLGSVIGLLWGFFDGAIGGALIAWIYNLFV